MVARMLPEDGELRLGSVRLPAGRRLTPDHGAPVAWVTRATVPDAGLAWSALADLHGETGLVAVVLNDDEDDLDDLFVEPCDVAELDPLDPAELLATHWEGESDDDDDYEEPGGWGTPRVNDFLGLNRAGEGPNSLFDIVMAVAGIADDQDAQAELSRLSELDREEAGHGHERPAAGSGERGGWRSASSFPGLAPATDGGLSSEARTAALRSVEPARIGLIPATRPADVLPALGWTCFDDPAYEDGIRNAVWIGAIFRSWEDRFGARLLAIGPGAQITLLVQRPPRTMEAAERIAAEHVAFCTECGGKGLRTVRDVAPALLEAPIWTFWWD